LRTSYYCYVSLATFALCLLTSTAEALPPGLLYLSQTSDVRSDALGGVTTTSTDAETGSASASGWHVSTLRVPHARVELLRTNPRGGSSTAATLERGGYALAQMRRPMRLGDNTRVTAEVAYRAGGRFERVDAEGKSVHAFPDVDMALGLALSRRLTSKLALSGAGRWLRSKYPDGEGDGQAGVGWAFDVGATLTPTAQWRVALTARNLSNGVSYPDPRRPRDPRREVTLAVGRSVRLSNAAELTLVADARVPSKRGTQGSAGAGLSFGDRVGVGVGYMRRVEQLVSSALIPASETSLDTRLWRAMGPTAGMWLRLAGMELSAAAGPGYLPIVLDDETHAVRNGRWQWSIGISPARRNSD
jgi:hypothetical protein